MSQPYHEDIFRSLRRIVRAIDLHSRKLTGTFHLTAPQLLLLHQLVQAGPLLPSELARQMFLSQATVTGIVDRLEKRGLVMRRRASADRRKVHVLLTDEGRELAQDMPLPLQDRFSERLAALPEEDQQRIAEVLAQVVEMMEATDIDAWPMVATGAWTDPGADQEPTPA